MEARAINESNLEKGLSDVLIALHQRGKNTAEKSTRHLKSSGGPNWSRHFYNVRHARVEIDNPSWLKRARAIKYFWRKYHFKTEHECFSRLTLNIAY